MESIKNLLEILPQVGRLEWIGLRSERLGEIAIVHQADVIAERGIVGDHKFKGLCRNKASGHLDPA